MHLIEISGNCRQPQFTEVMHHFSLGKSQVGRSRDITSIKTAIGHAVVQDGTTPLGTFTRPKSNCFTISQYSLRHMIDFLAVRPSQRQCLQHAHLGSSLLN